VTRIVAGAHGGRRLATPSGRATRPTSDRVREALFNSLAADVELTGARFADLYAGSGAVGLEAASRGAAHVLLVEADARTARTARANIDALGVVALVRLVVGRVENVVASRPEAPYDIVFADPPYAAGDAELARVLDALADNGWLVPGATVVVERASRSRPPPWPTAVRPVRGRRYGETTLWYGRAAGG
jgi:16S rRNA (guanine966-N2)-methyltransferase